MNESKIIESLKKQIDEIETLSKKDRKNPEFTGWVNKTVRILERINGKDSSYVLGFHQISFTLRTFSSTSEYKFEEAYQNGLKKAKSYLENVIEELYEIGLPENIKLDDKSNNMNQNSANAVVNVNVNNNLNLNINNVLENNLTVSQYKQLQKILSIEEEKEKENKLKEFFSNLGINAITEILKEIILG